SRSDFCSSSLLPLPLPTVSRSPYTTLFRSFHKLGHALGWEIVGLHRDNHAVCRCQGVDGNHAQGRHTVDENHIIVLLGFIDIGRSEEHTSELQSRFDLVCRLLLEKKNHNVA